MQTPKFYLIRVLFFPSSFPANFVLFFVFKDGDSRCCLNCALSALSTQVQGLPATSLQHQLSWVWVSASASQHFSSWEASKRQPHLPQPLRLFLQVPLLQYQFLSVLFTLRRPWKPHLYLLHVWVWELHVNEWQCTCHFVTFNHTMFSGFTHIVKDFRIFFASV